MEVKKFEDPSGNVWKYIFHFDDAIAEAVLYKYNSFAERTVMCVSVQSGCPVGCIFCGTGKRFIRNLTAHEICTQVEYLYKEVIEMEHPTSFNKFQVMFMSMGEPLLNFNNIENAIYEINKVRPFAQLLLSTIGVNNRRALNDLINLSTNIDQLGLQFSIHDAYDKSRNDIIPYKNKMNLQEIRNYGVYWSKMTGRRVYLNYCVTIESGQKAKLEELMKIFDPHSFAFTFSVVCDTEKGTQSVDNLEELYKIKSMFLDKGYNVRVFDPAGKDTIGAGCGQLWYVQDYFKTH